MKQVLRRGIRDIIVGEVPDPIATPQHVLIHPLYSLISSGTETASIHQEGVLKEVADNPSHIRKVWEVVKMNGPLRTAAEVRAKFSEYAVLGYSGAGVIIDKHPTVTDLEIGQRVAYGGEGTGHGEVILTGRNLVARVPDTVPFEQACFSTLGSIALNAVRIAQLGLGETVAVIGLGLVGQLVAQLARLQGAVVIATDLRADRVELARKLGAQHAIPGGESLKEAVSSATNGLGADCVIIAAAAKSAVPCQVGLQLCRDRGRMVVVGAVEMAFPWNDMYLKEIQLYMSRAYGPGSYDTRYEKQGQDYPLPYVRWTENRNMEEFLRLVGSGQVQVAPLVTHTFALDEAPQAYSTIMNPESSSLAVLLRYNQDHAEEAVKIFRPQRKLELAPAKNGLRVALVGSGNLARWAHLPALKKISGAHLHAVHSASGARGKTYGERFGAAYCTTDFQQIVNDPDIDLVLIISRNQQHASQAVAALRAGKHVFVEKPMALTEEECAQIWQAVQQSGKQLTVGFNRRFAPYYLELKKALSRRTGPAVINCRINSPGISGAYWMADPSIGGAILGEACHFVDLMYWLLGSEPIQVSAFSLPTGKQDPIGENNMAATFRFADGSVGNLTYCTVGSKTSGGERVEVFAQGMGAFTENFKEYVSKTGTQHRQKTMWAEKGYNDQLSAFIGSLRDGKAPAVTVLDGIRSTLGCLRMLDSARESAVFDLNLSEFLELSANAVARD
ncbi:MAG TPA: bi-domain-containing oxidoreductase [Bryobacteraceae bacterium]|nr:bi-domain-containing oxidoreductase [Bryobacteraceae bacterium]